VEETTFFSLTGIVAINIFVQYLVLKHTNYTAKELASLLHTCWYVAKKQFKCCIYDIIEDNLFFKLYCMLMLKIGCIVISQVGSR